MGKTARWLVENPLRRRLCLSDDETIDAVAGVPSIEWSKNLLDRQGERNDRVFRAIVGPERFAVESQGARRERDNSDIFNGRRFLLRIHSRDSPIFVRLFLSSQNVKRTVSERVTANLRANLNLADHIA